MADSCVDKCEQVLFCLHLIEEHLIRYINYLDHKLYLVIDPIDPRNLDLHIFVPFALIVGANYERLVLLITRLFLQEIIN